MMNTHAVVEADGTVERLMPSDTFNQLKDGQEIIQLVSPVWRWPEGIGELRCTPGGELFWVDSRSIEEVRAEKSKEITAARVAADLTTFPFMGEEIQCDQGGRSQIDGVSSYISLFGSLPPGFPGAWKTLANTYIPITDVETFKLMVQAMVAQGTANFLRSEAIKAYINAPERTLEEIQAVTWDMLIPS